MILLRLRTNRSLLLFIVLTGVLFASIPFSATTAPAAYKSAILIDYDTGQILYEENAHDPLIPASMVKLMVLFLVMEQLEAGNLHLSDQVTASEWAAKMGGQQIHLAKGETFTLQEMLDAMVIASANDAAVAVAEYLAGDVAACVDLMNTRAKALGMKNTIFANVHGLPAGRGQVDDVTTAYDIAILGRALVQSYPQVLEWTSTLSRQFPQVSEGTTYSTPFRKEIMTLVNTNNYLLRRVTGVDGLKTGYHSRAGFNVCVTAKQNDRRLIAVVMGAPSQAERNKAAKHLLNTGFTEFERIMVLQKGLTVGKPVPVVQGQKQAASLVAADNAIILVKKGDEDQIRQEIELAAPRLVAPVRQGTKVGEAVIFVGERPVTSVDLVIEEDIAKSSHS